MNIGNGFENLTQILSSQTAAATTTQQTGGANAQATLTADSTALSAVGTQAALAASLDDVRLDKVAGIQSALQAGTYRVPASDVAQKVINSLLVP